MTRLTDQQRELAAEHVWVVRETMRRMGRRIPPRWYDDLHQIGAVGLLNAAARWDASRLVRFPLYAWRFVSGAILDAMPRDRRLEQLSIDLIDGSARRRMSRIDASDELDHLTATLPQEQRDVMDLRRQGYVMGEIATKLGITSEQTRSRYEAAMQRMRRAAGTH